MDPACRRRGRMVLREERGSALMEVMISSLLVAMVAIAVFKGIDGASATSSGSKSRAVAAAVAESDQERLRGTPPADLVDRNETNMVVRGNVRYTVVSTSRWVADRDATPDCTSTTSRAGYLRIQSRVTWPDMRGSKPIVASSLVAPPNGTVTSNRGAIGIRILNEQNQGVPGVTVSVSGAGLGSKPTDAEGCAYWDDVPQGSYSYTAQRAGYVDFEGDASVTRPIGVTGGQTRFDTAYLDAATAMDVELVTRRYGGPQVALGTLPNDLNVPVRVANEKMEGLAEVRSFPASTSGTHELLGLYPMSYGVYAGPCARSNNPAEYNRAFQVNPIYPSPVRPTLPSINVRARIQGNYAAANGATVKFTLLPAGGETCAVTYSRVLQRVGTMDGALAQPELPYGRYRVCGEAFYNNAWWKSERVIDNIEVGGTDVLLDEASAASGRC